MNLDGLEQAVGGRVVRRGAADCEALRSALVWNGLKPARRPDAIVQVADVADVQAALVPRPRAPRGSGARPAPRPIRP